jgi:hypothetical protein
MLNISPADFEQRAVHRLSLHLSEEFAHTIGPQTVWRNYAKVPKPSGTDEFTSRVGEPKYIPNAKRNVEPAWKYATEQPDTSGESEYSSVAPKHYSVYIRRKFNYINERGHFGGFRAE